MLRFILITYVLFCCTFELVAQKKAVQKDLDVAAAYEALGEFSNAVEYLERVYAKTKDYAIASRIANAYHSQRLFGDAVLWRKKAHRSERSLTSLTTYAKQLITVGNYKYAKALVLKAVEQYGGDSVLSGIVQQCDSSLFWEKHPEPHLVTNLKKINTEFSEIAPVKNQEDLVFCSSREDIIIRPKHGRTGEPFYDLYEVSLSDGQPTGKIHSFSTFLNSNDHEGACAFADSGQTIYFSRIAHNRFKNETGTKTNSLKMFMSRKTNLGWDEAWVFRMDDTVSSFGHPQLSPDGSMFFFVSDMPGGIGGTDIYVCLKLDTLWSEPINLGESINTPGNEAYPMMSSLEQFYFASDWHLGMGGFDVFESKVVNGFFSSVTNMGVPINSPSDDFSFFREGNKAYMSSNRLGGRGREDIYRIDLR